MSPALPFDDAAVRVAAGADHHAEARALVDLLTLEEKLGCLDGDLRFWPGMFDMLAGGYTSRPWPAAAVERLGIPGIQFADGPRGCVMSPATAFPVSMARGASFDPALEERIGEAIGAELRAKGATYTGAVCLNLLRHPGWGRAQETYGEDPHHVGELAAALTRGLQRHVMACMKHFALNSMENARFKVDVTIDERALHEVYLPHFRRVADEGVASVMSAYNSVNGEWCGENATLLRTVLREEWAWDGFVTSDFTFGLRDPVKSVHAGLNIEMPFQQQRAQVLPDAAADGTLDLNVVDDLIVETVATLLRFAPQIQTSPPASVVACEAHLDLAHQAAISSMVLLSNDGTLPLDAAGLANVAVLGRLAALPNLGDHGSSNVLPPSVSTPLDGLRAALPEATVVHHATDASIARNADAVIVIVGTTKHDEGEFLDQAELASLGYLFPAQDHPTLGWANEHERDAAYAKLASRPPAAAEGQDGLDARASGSDFSIAGGDRRSLRLHPEDEALIAAASAVSDRVIVAVMGGSAFVMPWLATVGAAVMLWYPGMEGGRAMADVLLGRAEPGGRLPFAVPTSEDHLVPFDPDATTATYDLLHGQWKLDADGNAAHLPFGFGLSYTTFAIERAELREPSSSPGSTGPTTVEVAVGNHGRRWGSTVVQVYASIDHSAFPRPPRRLVGFAKVQLDAGESSSVMIPLDLDQLRVRVENGWHTEALPITLRIGQHAGDDAHHLTVSPPT